MARSLPPDRGPDLFGQAAEVHRRATAPLADRMRPRTLDEICGQRHLTAPGRWLRGMADSGRLQSVILWGPPGCGKTTLATVLAGCVKGEFVHFSAVLSGVRELRVLIDEAKERQRLHQRRTVLFVDEIHRFNKAQQDAFLPHVEDGTVTLIGATTENPSFEVIAPLLSRAKVVTLEALSPDDLRELIGRALADSERGLGRASLTLAPTALAFLADQARGDARAALNMLEAAADLAGVQGRSEIDLATSEEATQRRALLYDKTGEEHYNVISAFIKSMRGSDPDAALYWMMRMLEAGEEPLFIVRRMVIFAAEDIGNADPRALQVAVATKEAVSFIGLPEGKIPMAQAVTYLACAPKSNASYKAMHAATDLVRKHGALPVPKHLRNAPTALMKGLGYGQGYKYAHDFDGHVVAQQHLPDQLRGERFYHPSHNGEEGEIAERLGRWRDQMDASGKPERKNDDE